MKFILRLLIVTLTAFASEGFASTQFQSRKSISQAVYQYLASTIRLEKADYEIKIGRLDHRLRLNKCDTNLETFQPHNLKNVGRVTIGVRCAGETPWTIYTSAIIKKYLNVAVMAKSMPRGAILSRDDIRLDRKDVSKLRRGYLISTDDAIGQQLRRSLGQGIVLNAGNIARPKLIKKGQKVSIRALTGSIDIRMSGHALMDGGSGQLIQVRNDNSKRIIEGKVVAPGIIRVNL